MERFQSCRVVNHDFDWIKATYARRYIVSFFFSLRSPSHTLRIQKKHFFAYCSYAMWNVRCIRCVWVCMKSASKCVLMLKYSCCQLTGIHPHTHSFSASSSPPLITFLSMRPLNNANASGAHSRILGSNFMPQPSQSVSCSPWVEGQIDLSPSLSRSLEYIVVSGNRHTTVEWCL